MRRVPLAAGLAVAAVATAQALSGVPQRAALWRDVARYARLRGDDARRAACAPASWDLLEALRRRTPPAARILLVTTSATARGGPEDVLFHRALVELYPRAVRWASPAPASGWPVWWTPAAPGGALALARRWGATHVVTLGGGAPGDRLPGGAALLRLGDAR